MSATFPGRAGWPPEFRAAVVRAILSGSTVRDAAEDYGVSTASVWKWARAAGVEKRKPGPR